MLHVAFLVLYLDGLPPNNVYVVLVNCLRVQQNPWCIKERTGSVLWFHLYLFCILEVDTNPIILRVYLFSWPTYHSLPHGTFLFSRFLGDGMGMCKCV